VGHGAGGHRARLRESRVVVTMAGQQLGKHERPRRATGARNRRTLQAETHGLGVQLAAALDAVSDPLVVVDLTGQVVLLNRAFEAWIGRDAQRVLGKPVEALLAGAGRTDWYIAEVHGAALFAARVRAPGDESVVEVEARPLLDESGTLTHFCAVVKVQAREAPDPARIMHPHTLSTMGRLAAELAHDINNQLAVVLNYGFVLRRQLQPALVEHMDELQAAAWRASAVARKLLGFGRRPLSEPAPVQLGDTLRELEPLLAHVLQGMALELHVEPMLPSVVLVPSQAEQLLMGLCLELRELVGPGGRAVLVLSGVAVVPGADAPEALAPGRYLLLTATGNAGERPRSEGMLTPAPTHGPDVEGPITLHRLTRQLRGHLSLVSSPDRHVLRVLLPASEF
jgi:PAS domain S-box-containing protein